VEAEAGLVEMVVEPAGEAGPVVAEGLVEVVELEEAVAEVVEGGDPEEVVK
jgi:hypothetical protein